MGFAVLTDATAGSIIGQSSVKLLDRHKLINKWKKNKTQFKTSHQTAASPLCLSKYLKNNKEYRDSAPTVPCLCILFILYLWPVLDLFTALLMVCLQSNYLCLYLPTIGYCDKNNQICQRAYGRYLTSHLWANKKQSCLHSWSRWSALDFQREALGSSVSVRKKYLEQKFMVK